ncbi:hypothetical protein MHK_003176, partial [Candidatus Magnetomorum sp. HK-1]
MVSNFGQERNTMNKDEVPKKQKGLTKKTYTYHNQEQTDIVKTPSFFL